MEMTDIKLFSKILDFISILDIFYICFFALGGKKGANFKKREQRILMLLSFAYNRVGVESDINHYTIIIYYTLCIISMILYFFQICHTDPPFIR